VTAPLAGRWDVCIKTPIGSLQAEYVFTADGSGSATLKGETVPLLGIAGDGSRFTWRQAVTTPMRLNLEFDVTVDGDTLNGTSRAGRLPRSAVSGRRLH
jgi:hypothetical protein